MSLSWTLDGLVNTMLVPAGARASAFFFGGLRCGAMVLHLWRVDPDEPHAPRGRVDRVPVDPGQDRYSRAVGRCRGLCLVEADALLVKVRRPLRSRTVRSWSKSAETRSGLSLERTVSIVDLYSYGSRPSESSSICVQPRVECADRGESCSETEVFNLREGRYVLLVRVLVRSQPVVVVAGVLFGLHDELPVLPSELAVLRSFALGLKTGLMAARGGVGEAVGDALTVGGAVVGVGDG